MHELKSISSKPRWNFYIVESEDKEEIALHLRSWFEEGGAYVVPNLNKRSESLSIYKWKLAKKFISNFRQQQKFKLSFTQAHELEAEIQVLRWVHALRFKFYETWFCACAKVRIHSSTLRHIITTKLFRHSFHQRLQQNKSSKTKLCLKFFGG